ncbi:MAG: hypothetical protein ABL930_04325 [Pseudobdellovibrio sp.]
MLRKYLYVITPVILILIGLIVNISSPKKSFNFFKLDCSLFSRDGELLYKANPEAVFCAFANDGSVLISNPMTGLLSLIGPNDQTLWKSTEVAHHKIDFTPDQKNILIMSSEVISQKGLRLRSDCFSVRDLNNKKIHEWCASKNLKVLGDLGFDMTALWDIEGENNNQYFAENVKKEITHANSFYQITENSNTHPAFRAGNYIVHLFGESRALLILDKNLEKVLWHLDMSEFVIDHKLRDIDTHALQVTSRGTILAYFSDIIDKDTTASIYFNSLLNIKYPITRERYINKNLIMYSEHSRLIEFNPLNKEIIWQYQRHPLKSFLSTTFGWVYELSQNSFFFNDQATIYEINYNGDVLWSFTNPVINNSTGKPLKIIDIKAFKELDFLKARKMINP